MVISLDKDTILWIAGTVVAVITAIGVFVGPTIAHNRQEKNRKREDNLKTHFGELKSEIEEICRTLSYLTDAYGRIGSHSQAPYSEITDPNLPQASDNVKSHFPEVQPNLKEYEGTIKAHNKSYEELYRKIKDAFKSRGFDVLPINSSDTSPHIRDNFFNPLFQGWGEHSQSKANPQCDFSKIETKPEGGPNNLYVSGWGSAPIAYAQTEADKLNVREAIREVTQNKESEEEAARLVNSARQFREQVWTWQKEIREKADKVEKFWPGTEAYKFKRERICPKCKEIFG